MASPLQRKLTSQEAEQERRLRYLRRLQEQVAALRLRLSGVNDETRRLLAIQEQRSLTDEELRASRRLHRESEELRWELKRLFDEFERIRLIGGKHGSSR
jgi:hypothetical protein